MFNKRASELGQEPSAIRQLFAYGLERKAQIGADKVFDFSLGNPSVPAPQQVADQMVKLAGEPPAKVHGYTPAGGDPAVRQAVAASLDRRFGGNVEAGDLLMTDGASTSVSMVFRALFTPGVIDELVVPVPFFPEYRTWAESNGGKVVCVPSRPDDFQLDVPAIEAAVGPRTAAVIINSPNNPVGVVYTKERLVALADALRRAEKRVGHAVYLISDEPYRELVYGKNQVSWVPALYDDTVVCYSWSKSLSLPGERIGYVYVPKKAADAQGFLTALAGAARALGFVCAGATYQKVAAACCDVMPDTAPYERNRKLLCDILDGCGFSYVEPQGAFYLWMRSPEPNAQAFSDKAKSHELLIVPSDSFGVGGWVRLGYCVDESVIEGSADAFKALAADYGLGQE